MKVLLVEDDARTAQSLERGLREEGFLAEIASDGHSAVELALMGAYDILVMDVNLPGLDGIGALTDLRRRGVDVPVIFLTARDALEDRVRGLSLGADDYVVKPFAFSELIARIHAVLRRRAHVKDTARLSYEDLTVDLSRNKVWRGDTEISLTARELQLLHLFVRHAEIVLSRTYIAERVWDMNFDGDSNVVDVSVWRLRAKIDEPFPRKFIQTVRGRGYVFK